MYEVDGIVLNISGVLRPSQRGGPSTTMTVAVIVVVIS